MKTVGIVAEYNPFHNGHAAQIRYIREELHADYIVAVMSGDFVQRGTPALFPKHFRAETALKNGVDLVLELPVRVSTSSAEGFAAGAVELLDSLRCIDQLCFGSEHGDSTLFLQAAALLAEEPEAYRILLQNYLKEGRSFPAARSIAMAEYLNDDRFDALLSEPNNILGLEYCKAICRQESSIEPVTLKRLGHGYHDTALSRTEPPSASGIRSYLAEATEESSAEQLKAVLSTQIPENSLEDVVTQIRKNAFLTEEDFALLLHERLLRAAYTGTLDQYMDVSPALSQRILNTLNSYEGYSSYTALLKTREITYTHIQRALLHILLGIEKQPADPLSYARVLGFRRSASPLLRKIQEQSAIPLLQRLTDPSAVRDASSRTQTEETIFVSNLYEAVLAQKTHRKFRHELQKPIVIL